MQLGPESWGMDSESHVRKYSVDWLFLKKVVQRPSVTIVEGR